MNILTFQASMMIIVQNSIDIQFVLELSGVSFLKKKNADIRFVIIGVETAGVYKKKL
jgi:hypothetical protein